MTVHTAGENGLALFLDREDIELLGSTELNEKTARRLVNSTLTQMGVETGPVEISAFFGKNEAMVVALLGKLPARPWAFYSLSSQDDLLDVWKLSEGFQRKHFKTNGTHYIAFPEHDQPRGISEFAKRVYRPQLYLTYLEEHNEQ